VTLLEQLGYELAARGLNVTLAPESGTPVLEVVNRHAYLLSERVTCSGGWFWRPEARRIAPVDDIGAAADEVMATVLSCPAKTDGGGRAHAPRGRQSPEEGERQR
jgi:hypothetical protein